MRNHVRFRGILRALIVIGSVGSLVGFGTYAAFSSTSGNSGNTYAAGTVAISDNDAGSAMYAVTNRIPGNSVATCIRVTYTGSLGADVRLYTLSAGTAVDQYLDLTVEKGAMPGSTTFPNCTSFASQATIYSGTVQGFKTAKNSYANGIAANPGAQTKWNQNDSLAYRFTVTLQNSYAAQGLTSTTAFTWEARNQ